MCWRRRRRAVDQAQHTLDAVLTKARFWQRRATTPLNERQVKLLNKLLDGIEGKLTSSKWAAIAKCSPDTALRDINDLLTRGVLRKSDAGGRSTSYELNDLPVGWHPGLNLVCFSEPVQFPKPESNPRPAVLNAGRTRLHGHCRADQVLRVRPVPGNVA